MTTAARPRTRVSSPTRTGGERRTRPTRGTGLALSERGRRLSTTPAADAARGDGAMLAQIPFVVLVLVLIGAGIGLTLLLSGKATSTEMVIAGVREDTRALRENNESLERDVERAESPSRLAAAAAELGLIPIYESAVLVVGPDGATRMVGTPAPARGDPLRALEGEPIRPRPPTTDSTATAPRNSGPPAGALPHPPAALPHSAPAPADAPMPPAAPAPDDARHSGANPAQEQRQ